MTNKRYLNDLTIDELKKVFENNQSIRDEVFRIVDDDNYYLLQNDYVSHFRHYNKCTGRENYTVSISWDAWNNISAYAEESDYKSFLEDCKTIISYNGCLEKLKGLIERLSERVDFFEESLNGYTDIAEKNWNHLSKWFYMGIGEILEELEREMQEIQDTVFDEDYLFEYFSDEIYLDNTTKYIVDDDYTTVYEDITKEWR